jgi:catechol 2,3-dioxygenase-like lactoylglutathione lyase family enzyme
VQIGDLKKSLDFYEQDFGMHVHRHEVGLRNVLHGRGCWDGDRLWLSLNGSWYSGMGVETGINYDVHFYGLLVLRNSLAAVRRPATAHTVVLVSMRGEGSCHAKWKT